MRKEIGWFAWCVVVASAASVTSQAGAQGCAAAQQPCCQTSSSPGCSNRFCCEAVCAIIPTCCTQDWDDYCVLVAHNICGVPCFSCGFKDNGPCCEPHVGGFCNDELCCNVVCSIDSWCCEAQWDSECVKIAEKECGVCTSVCGGAATGNCCLPHGTPFCDNTSCCQLICGMDSYCCTNNWDTICANEANLFCGVCGDTCGALDAGDCCQVHAGAGCADEVCCELVCAVDPTCCQSEWDESCAIQALALCGTCPDSCGTGAGDCCDAHAGPGCNDPVCCSFVCSVDPSCCLVEWDGPCVLQAALHCAYCGYMCGALITGPCCTVHPLGGCNDEACCQAVCAVDHDCCALTWDALCVTLAQRLCTDCGAGCGAGGADCCVAHPSPGCNDPACCDYICSFDAACCEFIWDGICRDNAIKFCAVCGQSVCGVGAGDCCAAHGSAGCSDPDCCDMICTLDGFCCGVQWDQFCVQQAQNLCAPCAPCLGDINHDGTVGGADITALLGVWGAIDPFNPADLNDDGVMDGADITVILGNWGPCR